LANCQPVQYDPSAPQVLHVGQQGQGPVGIPGRVQRHGQPAVSAFVTHGSSDTHRTPRLGTTNGPAVRQPLVRGRPADRPGQHR
jgi:hypothetical protein